MNRSNRPGMLVMVTVLLTVTGIPMLPTRAEAQPPARTQAEALADSALARLARGDAPGAMVLATDAVRLDTRSARVRLALGRAWLQMPHGAGRAIEQFTAGLRENPHDLNLRYYKALAHIRLAPTDWGRSNANAARRELEYILNVDPSHGDAYYQRGLLYRDVYGDLKQAADDFRRQTVARSDHYGASFELMRQAMDTGRWEAAITTGFRLIEIHPDSLGAYAYLGGALWKAGRGGEAMKIFEAYFQVAPQKERDLYFDLGYLLTPAENAEYRTLDEAGRHHYWTDYWRSRNPRPDRGLNDRLLEHYIRVAWSRIEFGSRQWPWDARGDFYVRYGEPDLRLGAGRPFPDALIDELDFFIRQLELYQALGLEPPDFNPEVLIGVGSIGFDPRVDGSGTPERWLYLESGIDMSFDNPVMSGRYLRAEQDAPKAFAMERRLPVISPQERRIVLLDPLHAAVTFRAEQGQTELLYLVGLMEDDLGGFRSATGTYARLQNTVNLYEQQWSSVQEVTTPPQGVYIQPNVRHRGLRLFVYTESLLADPGSYTLSTWLVEQGSGRQASLREPIELPDYSGSSLMISDILPAAEVTVAGKTPGAPLRRKGLDIVPLPIRVLQPGQELVVYFEIYNLDRDATGSSTYTVSYAVAESDHDRSLLSRAYRGLRSSLGLGGREAVVRATADHAGIREEETLYLAIELGSVRPGTYELEIGVNDRISGQIAASSLVFRVVPPQIRRR